MKEGEIVESEITVKNQRIRQERIERGINAQVFADLIGVNVPTYYKKEAGDLRFSLLEAKKIADYLSASIDELFF